MIYFLIAICSLLIGFIAAYFLVQSKLHIEKKKQEELNAALIEKNAAIENLKKFSDEKIIFLQDNINSTISKLSEEQLKNVSLTEKLARSEENVITLNNKLKQQLSDIESLQKTFSENFELLASRILKQNTIEFAENNQKKISEILTPLKEKILSFEKQVSETYEKGLKDQSELKAELKKLYDLNNHISEEAHNLTKALKGDNKLQGNWGEVVLERILERSGLTKDQEYFTQYSARNESGEIIRPDVVIKLPENKHIIIDSKVSLVAYEQFANTSDNEEKAKFAKMHVDSIKNHVKGLSEKHYYTSKEIPNTPEFVLLFIPIESSFSTAIQNDIDLFNFAWDRRVIIVSPSTLLATLKTIESIWKREKQTQNAIEIASEGGKLYDKFAGLIEDLNKLGNQLETVQKTYQEANKKLHTGSGNLMGKVRKLQLLGAKNTKNLPQSDNTELFDSDENE